MTTLVTGGTGTLGTAYVHRHVHHELIRVLSRDEEKQRVMAARHPEVEFVIGDVRDPETVRRAMRGCDRVIHAAAMKQVPACEQNPGEAYRTNVVGTENVARAAADHYIPMVLVSTDKAVEPVNTYGATKMLAEAVARQQGAAVVRYGNVIGSTGSVIPVFRAQRAAGKPFTVTDPDMTRFLLTLDQALDLIDTAAPGALTIPRDLPAATVGDIVTAIDPDWPVNVIGARPGEKRHEMLAPGYTSEHARRLSIAELRALL